MTPKALIKSWLVKFWTDRSGYHKQVTFFLLAYGECCCNSSVVVTALHILWLRIGIFIFFAIQYNIDIFFKMLYLNNILNNISCISDTWFTKILHCQLQIFS